MPNGRDVYETAYREGWRPEPRLAVSTWADEHRVLGNRAGKTIPTVPTHRRRQRDGVADHDAKCFLRLAERILRDQRDDNLAPFLQFAGEVSGLSDTSTNCRANSLYVGACGVARL